MNRLITCILNSVLSSTDSPLVRRLVGGGFWSLMGEAGARAFSFASSIFVARCLGVVDFGVLAFIQSTLAMFMTFAMFGMGSTSTRYIAAYRDKEPDRIDGIIGITLYFSVLTGLTVAVLLFVAAPYITNRLLLAPELKFFLRIVTPVLFLYAVSGALIGILRGFEEFRVMAQITLACSIINFVALIVGISYWGLLGAFIALVGSETVRFTLIIWIAFRVKEENGFKLFGRINLSES